MIKKRHYLLGTSFNFVFEFECIVSKAGVCCCCLYDRVHCYFLSVLQAISQVSLSFAKLLVIIALEI